MIKLAKSTAVGAALGLGQQQVDLAQATVGHLFIHKANFNGKCHMSIINIKFLIMTELLLKETGVNNFILSANLMLVILL